MLKRITVENYIGETLEMDLYHPEDCGFVIESIDGLGPVKANINTSESATNDGTIFNSARSEQRNIVMHLKFLFNPTIEETRLQSYRYFPNKKPLKLTVETDKRKAYVTGYVESNEPDIFSAEEGCQISIICPDPFFYSIRPQQTMFSGVDAEFEFPFENTEGTNEIMFGNLTLSTMQKIVYNGDSDIGMTIYIHALGPFTNLSLFNAEANNDMVINTSRITDIVGSAIQANDDIIIETTRGKKSMKLVRDGHVYSILSALGKDTNWLSLNIGENTIYYVAESGEENVQISIENQIVYAGV